jgi:TRAP-type C4-dicarboxylate transport system permease small subunit
MKKFLSWCQKLDNFVLVITFSVMVLASFAQVVNRNIFKLPISGLEEVSKYCMIYMVLLGTELGLRDGTQISVTAIVDKLKGFPKKIIQIISKLILVVFSAAVFYKSVELVQQQITSGQTSPGLQLPMSIPYCALLISFGIITLVQGVLLLNMIKNFNKPDMPEQEAGV